VGATTMLTTGIADPLRLRTMGIAADASASEFEPRLLSHRLDQCWERAQAEVPAILSG